MEEDFKKVVIDASVVVAKLLGENNEGIWEEYKKGTIELVAPNLLLIEVGNALRTGVLRKRIELNLAKELYEIFLNLPIEKYEVEWLAVLELAIAEGLSFYDAMYVWLAIKHKWRLVSFDKQLIKVWRKRK